MQMLHRETMPSCPRSVQHLKGLQPISAITSDREGGGGGLGCMVEMLAV